MKVNELCDGNDHAQCSFLFPVHPYRSRCGVKQTYVTYMHDSLTLYTYIVTRVKVERLGVSYDFLKS